MTPNPPGDQFDDWRERRRQKWEARMQRRMGRRAHHTYGGISAGHGKGGHLVIGTIILLLGILFLLENLGYFQVARLWEFWPVILIAVGTAKLIDSRGKNWIPGTVLTLIGLIFLANNIGLLGWNIWKFVGPALLILAGVLILVRGSFRFDDNVYWTGAFQDSGTSIENMLHEYAIFGGVNRRVESQDFRGGEALAVFGGVEIDMHRAATTREEISVDVNAIFGGVEMWVPDAWDVIVRGSSILGGFEDKTHRPSSNLAAPEGVKRPRLVIRGSAVFGGVVVKN
jgi:predicted membrane protein